VILLEALAGGLLPEMSAPRWILLLKSKRRGGSSRLRHPAEPLKSKKKQGMLLILIDIILTGVTAAAI